MPPLKTTANPIASPSICPNIPQSLSATQMAPAQGHMSPANPTDSDFLGSRHSKGGNYESK